MKISAHGTILNMGDGIVTPVYTAIAQVESFDGPEIARGSVEAAAHDDADMIERIQNGLYSMGPVSGTLLYDPADASHDASTGLLAVVESGEERAFQFIFPDTAASQIDFNGYVSRFKPSGLDANTGLMRAEFEITPMNSPALP